MFVLPILDTDHLYRQVRTFDCVRNQKCEFQKKQKRAVYTARVTDQKADQIESYGWTEGMRQVGGCIELARI